MTTITPDLVPCRHRQLDHWESVSEYNGRDQAPWVEYVLTGGPRDVHGFFFYVGPAGKSVREFSGPMLPGPHTVFIEVHRSALFHRPSCGEPVPDSIQPVAPGDVVVLNGVPMTHYWCEVTRKHTFAEPVTVEGHVR